MKSYENQLRLRTLIEYGVYYLLSAALVFLEIKKIGIVDSFLLAKSISISPIYKAENMKEK